MRGCFVLCIYFYFVANYCNTLFVCRLIVATLIGNFLMIPSNFRTEILAIRTLFCALGTRGLNRLNSSFMKGS